MSAPVLLAVAHGSREPAAAASVETLLDEVRRQRPGIDVRACYLDHGSPSVAEAVTAVAGSPAVAVPLLLTAAFHTDVDLPARLAEAETDGAAVLQGAALGPDDRLLRALERRLAAVGVPAGDAGTAVVLAAAGSSRQDAVQTVRLVAQQWRTGGWREVVAAFASAAAPKPAEAVAGLRARGATRVAVAPYLLFPGRFADSLAGAGADVVAAPLGDAPEVVEVMLDRYDAAVARLRTGRR